jgi:molybdopterin-guanine dinucleotide biosynthesis protein MobB
MRVFAVSGYSFSGKTFLLEQLIIRLRIKGKTVATVKSSQHDIRAPEGTDTWRHQVAGASTTVLLGPSTTTLRFEDRLDLRRISREVSADYLLLEGFKNLDIPRFWCVGETPMKDGDMPPMTKAIVIWEGADCDYRRPDVPVIENSKIDELIQIVEELSVDINEAF